VLQQQVDATGAEVKKRREAEEKLAPAEEARQQ